MLDVRLLSVGLLQQQSNLLLCVGNPNDRPLNFRRSTFDVDVAGRPLAHGDSVVAVELPPHQAVPVPVALTSTTANLGSQLVGVLLTGGVDYRVTGRSTRLPPEPRCDAGARAQQKNSSQSWALGYVLAQIAGGIVAAGVLLVIAKGTGHYDPVAAGFASNGYGDRSPGHYSMAAAFLTETVLTALLVLVILGSTDIAAPVGFAGIAIGLLLTLIHLVSIPVTNTSVNPARSIGPALFAGPAALGQLWLFIVAPLLGGAIAAPIYALLRAVEPGAQLSVRQATQALPTEQEQRLTRAVPSPIDPPAAS